MSKAIKILVAEDIRETRNLLIDTLRLYAAQNDLLLLIDSAESFIKADQKLNESENNREYFDIFFADIDFSEDNKGGEPDSGYKLIEKAFEISPLTQIVTFSGQFTHPDLWQKYEELKNRGLIVKTMNKSHGEGGEEEWIKNNLKDLFRISNEQNLLWDIWLNHKLVETAISKSLGLGDLKYATSIRIQLDGVTTLIKQLNKIDEKETIYRLIVPMYHQILERYCQGSKTNDQIIKDSDDNLKAVNAFYQFDLNFEPTTEEYKSRKSNPNSQRILCSYSAKPEISYALDLNWLRNKCMHNLDFRLSLNHVLYANLVLALVIAGKEGIFIQNISPLNNEKGLPDHGAQKLRDIIEFIKS